MPAGTALAPRRFPGGFTGFGRFPEGKIHRVFFTFIHFHPGPGQHFVKGTPGELAVVRKTLDRKIDVAVNRIGMAFFQKPCDHLDNLRDVFGDFRVDVGFFHAQGGQVLHVDPGIIRRQFQGRPPFLLGPADNFIINIGDVLHHKDLVPAGP